MEKNHSWKKHKSPILRGFENMLLFFLDPKNRSMFFFFLGGGSVFNMFFSRLNLKILDLTTTHRKGNITG